MGHTRAVAQQIHGDIQISLADSSGFGLCFRIVQKNLPVTEDDKVVVRSIPFVLIRGGDILHRMITGHRAGKAGSGKGSLAQTRISGIARIGILGAADGVCRGSWFPP